MAGFNIRADLPGQKSVGFIYVFVLKQGSQLGSNKESPCSEQCFWREKSH